MGLLICRAAVSLIYEALLYSAIIYFFFSLTVAPVADAAINEIVWEDVSRSIRDSDLQTIAINPDNGEIVYINSFNAVYKTVDGGKSWDEVLSFRGTGNTIHSVAISPLKTNVVYAGTQDGLYRGADNGMKWEKIFSGIGDLNSSILFIAVSPVNPENIFIGTKACLFWTDNGGVDWKRGQNLPSDAVVSSIAIDFSKPNIIYAVTDRGLYKSINSGIDWKRIVVTTTPTIQDNIGEDSISGQIETVEDNGVEIKIRSVVINPSDTRILYLGTSDGLLVSEDAGLTWKTTGSSGIISRDIRHLVISPADPDGVYAATGRGVFRYSKSSDRWEELYKGLTSVDIRFLAHAPAVQDRTLTLWAATKQGIFKTTYTIQNTGTKNREVVSERALSIFADEPSIEEIQRAAIRYAEVHPEKIEGWRKAASKKAWLPDLTLQYSKGRDWQRGTYYNTTSGRYWEDDVTQGKDYDWSVSLKWELGGLIWNDDQTSIDTRSRLMVQLRDDVLNEVTRLYFERRRLQMEMLLSSPKEIKDKIEKELRLHELTADIDALTDFYLSKRLAQLKERKVQNEKFKMQN